MRIFDMGRALIPFILIASLSNVFADGPRVYQVHKKVRDFPTC
jgi:hypothetical protein